METNKSNILLGKYEVGRLLGQGTFAKVYLAKNPKSNQTVAIKAFDKERVCKAGLTEQIEREVSVMKMLNHPNIIELYEVMATKKRIYFVMEYARGGELFQRVSKGGRVKEEIAHKYFRQLIEAVRFCHGRWIYHRDLKLENLLLDEEDNLKVTDFGLSALIGSDHDHNGLLHTACGTPAYVAPEVLSKKGYNGAKTDIWSCGVILFVLVAGYLPFHDSNLMEMYKKIQNGEFKCPSWFSSRLKKLLRKILDPDPLTRIGIEEIKGMSWYRKGFEIDQFPKEMKAKESVTNGVKSIKRRERMRVASMNAFDIISLSSGFDLSGFFVEKDHRNETWFTCRQPVSVLVSRLEELAKSLRLRVRKKENGVVKMVARNGGRKGVVEIDAEIFQIDMTNYMVEIKKSSGDTLEYQKILKEEIRPGLKDIVWTWQGDQVEQ